MNYIIQLNAFYDRLEINPLNSSEIALWNALMSINNKTAWSDKFTVAASVLCNKAGMKNTSKSSNFFKARNGLTQAGLITWKSRKGNQAAEYTITKLYSDLSTYSVDNSVDSSVGNGVDSSVGSSVTLNKHKQKHKKTSSRNRKKRTYDENSDYMKLAKFLQKQILINKPDFKQPVLQTWADDMRKLVELDKRDKHDVALVIKWCQQDSFWSTNILSAYKLRKQFDQLYLKMQASKGSSPEPRASKHDDQIKKTRREREKFVLYKYSEVGNDLDKALPMIQAKYPEIDSKDKALRILYPERYMTAGGVENGY
ncbi:hypothetical protein QUF07_12200 [Lentilactobacillus sp. TOM.63]|uniref:hypothetical protein n=1 Tax=Lentilactobacillus sp. TOM.63 TaxID=3055077 RepID=UPI0025A2BB4D|nr:hypothetical protein [Lentilactobacillus sp. TOM.63]MDM7517450.1 hypothetical protein [Lentilactobacillus sp. TOM.63]